MLIENSIVGFEIVHKTAQFEPVSKFKKIINWIFGIKPKVKGYNYRAVIEFSYPSKYKTGDVIILEDCSMWYIVSPVRKSCSIANVALMSREFEFKKYMKTALLSSTIGERSI
jgi:hypothetical protein